MRFMEDCNCLSILNVFDWRNAKSNRTPQMLMSLHTSPCEVPRLSGTRRVCPLSNIPDALRQMQWGLESPWVQGSGKYIYGLKSTPVPHFWFSGGGVGVERLRAPSMAHQRGCFREKRGVLAMVGINCRRWSISSRQKWAEVFAIDAENALLKVLQ